jgi:hypothetical protein
MITAFLLDPEIFVIAATILVCVGCIITILLFELTMYAMSRIKRAKRHYDQVKLFDGYDVVREAEYIAMMRSEKVEEFDD